MVYVGVPSAKKGHQSMLRTQGIIIFECIRTTRRLMYRVRNTIMCICEYTNTFVRARAHARTHAHTHTHIKAHTQTLDCVIERAPYHFLYSLVPVLSSSLPLPSPSPLHSNPPPFLLPSHSLPPSSRPPSPLLPQSSASLLSQVLDKSHLRKIDQVQNTKQVPGTHPPPPHHRLHEATHPTRSH